MSAKLSNDSTPNSRRINRLVIRVAIAVGMKENARATALRRTEFICPDSRRRRWLVPVSPAEPAAMNSLLWGATLPGGRCVYMDECGADRARHRTHHFGSAASARSSLAADPVLWLLWQSRYF